MAGETLTPEVLAELERQVRSCLARPDCRWMRAEVAHMDALLAAARREARLRLIADAVVVAYEADDSVSVAAVEVYDDAGHKTLGYLPTVARAALAYDGKESSDHG